MRSEQSNLALELEMKALGVMRHEKEVAKAKAGGRLSTVEPARGAVVHMVEAAEAELDAMLKPKRGRPAAGVALLRKAGLPGKVLAYVGAKTVVDAAGGMIRLQTVLRRVGQRVEDQVRMRRFKRREPKLWQWMQDQFKERGSADYAHQRRVFVAAMRRSNVDEGWNEWSPKDQAEVGVVVVEALRLSGMLTVERHRGANGKRWVLYLAFTPEAEQALRERDEMVQALITPWYKPMVLPPQPWTTPTDGGYHTLEMSMVKIRKRRGDLERLRAADMPEVYSALNYIQGTAWRVNEDVLCVVHELLDADSGRAGLPSSTEFQPPSRPDLPPMGTPLDELEKARLRAYKAEKSHYHNAEARRKGHMVQILQTVAVADQVKDTPIWFPHQLDYRGRAYAVPLQLNPQGNDLSRGLLTFAKGVRLGEMGAFHLAVHGANCWGEDKVDLNARVDWVLDHEEQILAVASDPLTERWWEEADKPWQFLAFCLEWAAYRAFEDGESPDFMSHLPVSVDGSCNGLQHFSAMLRDPVGGAATNLTPAPLPNDIYMQVAERVSEAVALSSDEQAAEWLAYGIDRKLVKRQVMTTPYGATPEGMKQQLIAEIRHRGDEGRFDNAFAACIWLAPIIYAAIGEVVTAAHEAMGYIQEGAGTLAGKDLPLAWTTPTGFPVVQEELNQTRFEVNTLLLGRIKLRYRVPGQRLDKRRQKSAASPNFIHSYDAAHLQLTVCEMARRLGDVSWAVVHDSFGTHAGHIEELHTVLRTTFVRMYEEHAPLDELHQRSLALLPSGAEIPAPPAEGDLDLDQVLASEFFFN